MDCSMPGLPVHHQVAELAQTQVPWVGDAVQPSHPLSSPSPSTFNHHCATWEVQYLYRCARLLSGVWLFETLCTVARQASLSMGFFKKEYWSGLPFPPPGDLPDPGIKSTSLHPKSFYWKEQNKFMRNNVSLASQFLEITCQALHILIIICFIRQQKKQLSHAIYQKDAKHLKRLYLSLDSVW